MYQGIPKWRGRIGVWTGEYSLAIPLDQVVAVNATGTNNNNGVPFCEVVYQWRGKEQKMLGHIDGDFYGTTEFGDFKLRAASVKKLTFTKPPLPQKTQAQLSAFSATVTLHSGKQFTLTSLLRHGLGHQKTIVGISQQVEIHVPNYRFERGESEATLDFDAIKRIDYGANINKEDADKNWPVTVTLKNGKTVSGSARFEVLTGRCGWLGDIEKGMVHFDSRDVKTVEFDTTATKTKKGEGK